MKKLSVIFFYIYISGKVTLHLHIRTRQREILGETKYRFHITELRKYYVKGRKVSENVQN